MANKNVTKKALAEKDAEIKKNMEILGISREEAEEMWAFDHDEIDCEEVDAIEDKIRETQKSDKKKAGSTLDKVRNMKAKKKADAEKHNIIQSVFSFLKTLGETGEIISPQEMSTTKMSFKGVNGGYYTVTITKHKSCPDGYKEP